MQTHKEYTYWVLPAEPHRGQLTAVIGDLAREFDAAPFDPHVTVFCSRSNDAEAKRVAQHITQTFKPFELQATGLEQSALLTKTFYVQFAQSPHVQKLFEALRDTIADKPNDSINPHLSLLYQRTAEAQRQELCRRTAIVPMGACRFDTLRVVELDIPIEDLQPIRVWRTVAEYPLQPG